MLLVSSTLALVSGVSADQVKPDPCAMNASGAVMNPAKCDLQKKRDEMKKKIDERRAANQALHATNTGATRDFHMSNSGAIRDAVKSLTGAQRDEFRDAKEDQKDLRASMSGKTLEQKLSSRDALEAAQKAKLEAKYVNNPELLAKNLAVYEANKARRDEMIANRTETLLERSALSVEATKTFDTQVRANMSSLSPERKVKLVTKIDARIAKVQAAKGITAASQTEMVAILTALKADLQK